MAGHIDSLATWQDNTVESIFRVHSPLLAAV